MNFFTHFTNLNSTFEANSVTASDGVPSEIDHQVPGPLRSSRMNWNRTGFKT